MDNHLTPAEIGFLARGSGGFGRVYPSQEWEQTS
jgi:hypothetical protein